MFRTFLIIAMLGVAGCGGKNLPTATTERNSNPVPDDKPKVDESKAKKGVKTTPPISQN